MVYPLPAPPGFIDVWLGMLKSLSLTPPLSVYLGTHCRKSVLNVVWTCWCYLPPQSSMAVPEIHHPLHKEIHFSLKICLNLPTIFLEHYFLLHYVGNNSFAITSSTAFMILQTSRDSITPYLFGSLNGLAGLEGGKKRVIENIWNI